VTLTEILDRLESRYGRPKPPELRDPFEMILWENVVYLADDEARGKAFRALQKEIGTQPAEVLRASRDRLLRISSLAGILPEQCMEKVRDAAEIAQREFGGDLRPVLRLPLAEAKRALRKFPGIGDPGAEKILLFAGAHPFLALESNGIRVLLRLGYGEERKSYGTAYRLVQQAAGKEAPEDCAWRVRAHQLFRRHGQDTCKRSDPLCEQCSLARECPSFAKARGGRGKKA
jgi:endonuclease-3